ncbi:hypothetical protein ACA910_013902 [Epithemia clementina (nom. ined.)]
MTNTTSSSSSSSPPLLHGGLHLGGPAEVHQHVVGYRPQSLSSYFALLGYSNNNNNNGDDHHQTQQGMVVGENNAPLPPNALPNGVGRRHHDTTKEKDEDDSSVMTMSSLESLLSFHSRASMASSLASKTKKNKHHSMNHNNMNKNNFSIRNKASNIEEDKKKEELVQERNEPSTNLDPAVTSANDHDTKNSNVPASPPAKATMTMTSTATTTTTSAETTSHGVSVFSNITTDVSKNPNEDIEQPEKEKDEMKNGDQECVPGGGNDTMTKTSTSSTTLLDHADETILHPDSVESSLLWFSNPSSGITTNETQEEMMQQQQSLSRHTSRKKSKMHGKKTSKKEHRHYK